MVGSNFNLIYTRAISAWISAKISALIHTAHAYSEDCMEESTGRLGVN